MLPSHSFFFGVPIVSLENAALSLSSLFSPLSPRSLLESPEPFFTGWIPWTISYCILLDLNFQDVRHALELRFLGGNLNNPQGYCTCTLEHVRLSAGCGSPLECGQPSPWPPVSLTGPTHSLFNVSIQYNYGIDSPESRRIPST